MTTSAEEPVVSTEAPKVANPVPVAVAELSGTTSKYAPVSSAGNGYEVISQHPVPDHLHKATTNASSEVAPLILGFLMSAVGFFGSTAAGLHTVAICVLTLIPPMLGCYLGIRIGERRKLILKGEPAVLAMSAESGIPADELAYALYRVANRGRMIPVSVRSNTKVFLNIQNFEAGDGVLPRLIPKDEQSIGLLRRVED